MLDLLAKLLLRISNCHLLAYGPFPTADIVVLFDLKDFALDPALVVIFEEIKHRQLVSHVFGH